MLRYTFFFVRVWSRNVAMLVSVRVRRRVYYSFSFEQEDNGQGAHDALKGYVRREHVGNGKLWF